MEIRCGQGMRKYGVYDLYGVTQMPSETLYKEFGTNAEYEIIIPIRILQTIESAIGISSQKIIKEDAPSEAQESFDNYLEQKGLSKEQLVDSLFRMTPEELR